MQRLIHFPEQLLITDSSPEAGVRQGLLLQLEILEHLASDWLATTAQILRRIEEFVPYQCL